MAVRVAINGFGRIGRLILRALHERNRDDVQIVAVNDLGSPDTFAHLLKHDTALGTLPLDVTAEADRILVGHPDGRVDILSRPENAAAEFVMGSP